MTVEAADDVFLEHRGAVFGLAYRMLGSVADAEDIVSETYLRWQRADHGRSEVTEPRAFLFTVASRLSIDVLRSARRQRVDYVGTWLPEPLVSDWEDPADTVVTRDTLSLGLLMLLEQLTPVERAVFVLREAFDYPHDAIAELLGTSAVSARQHYRRARRRLDAAGAPRFVADPVTQDEILRRFVAASLSGEVQPLADLLAADAVLYADGGGKAQAILRPAYGAVRLARFFRGLVRQAPPDLRVDLVRANTAPALLVRTSQEVVGVYALDVDDATGLVRAIHAIRNPDKLQRLSV
jgi:RNA polymerase sigma-70 factor (ECF subfamily)